MLYCKDCDYFGRVKDELSDKDVMVCRFAQFVFAGDPENSDMEYPCKEISYDEYLERESLNRTAVKNQYAFVDWRFNYIRTHTQKAKASRLNKLSV